MAISVECRDCGEAHDFETEDEAQIFYETHRHIQDQGFEIEGGDFEVDDGLTVGTMTVTRLPDGRVLRDRFIIIDRRRRAITQDGVNGSDLIIG